MLKIKCDINQYYLKTVDLHLYVIRRSLIVGSITEVKQRRARFIIGWVTAWDCQDVNQMARLTDLELDVKEPQWT